MNKTKTILSLIFNSLIYVLMIIGLVLTFTTDQLGLEAFIYFTTDSNILMGFAAFAYLVCLVINLIIKSNKIPKAIELIKLTSTTAVTLTFFTVIFFLTWTIDNPAMLYMGSGAIFHIAIPLLSIITWLLFEHSSSNIKLIQTLYGLIPTGIYSIAYMCVALTHVKNGSVSWDYDWYGFTQFGLGYIPLVVILMLGATYLFSWLLWLGNKKINLFNKKKISARH